MASIRSIAAAWLRRRAAPLRAVDPLELVVAVVEGVAQVGGGPPGLAAADRAVVEDDDRPARPRQQVGRRQPAIPAPTTQTSAPVSSARAHSRGMTVVAILTEVLRPDDPAVDGRRLSARRPWWRP